jgi:hypothetical protein
MRMPDADHDNTDRELAELALKLRALECDHEDEGLFPESFMQEFTDFRSWDEFKVRLAATPRADRESFMTSTTRFKSYEAMESAALERLMARRSNPDCDAP